MFEKDPRTFSPEYKKLSPEQQAMVKLEITLSRFFKSLDRSISRWQRLLIPLVIVLGTLGLSGFYLIYHMTKDMDTMSAGMDPNMQQHLQSMSENMASLSKNIGVMTEQVGQLVKTVEKMNDNTASMKNNMSNMDKNMTSMTSNMSEMNESIKLINRNTAMMSRDMGHLNYSISRPASVINSMPMPMW